MLTHYPALDETAIARQGQSWWTCDAEGCGKEVQLPGPEVPKTCPNCDAQTNKGPFCASCGFKFLAEIPKGWRTSDPNQDPHQGAAQMCPKHAANIVFAPDDAPPPIVEG